MPPPPRLTTSYRSADGTCTSASTMPTALRHTSRSRSSGDIGIDGDGDGARFASSTANAANTCVLLSDISAVAAASTSARTCHVRHKLLHGTDEQNLDQNLNLKLTGLNAVLDQLAADHSSIRATGKAS